QAGQEPLELKPDVCWQLPIRRSYRTVERPDGTSYLEISLTEFDRRAWGAGGKDFDWYCTGNLQAHSASVPIFMGMEAELRELIGDNGYELLAAACRDAMEASQAPGRSDGTPGADLDRVEPRRLLPLTVITHPATAATDKT